MNSSKPCSPMVIAGRLSKAIQFFNAAEIIKDVIEDNDLADALVTLCVHAGIAASDVICCMKLEKHPSGPDHRNAVKMLSEINPNLGRELKNLLDMKGHSGYSEHITSRESCESAFKSADALLSAAEKLMPGIADLSTSQ